MEAFAAVYLGLALAGSLMALAQRRWPAGGAPPALDRSRTNDLAWWLFSPLVTGTFTRVATLGAAFSLAWALGYGLDAGAMLRALHAVMPLRPWSHPLAWQWFEALALADLVGYWSHRLRHTRWLWPLHAVHHSASRLDWLAAARMHPLDDLVDELAVGAVTLACFDPRVFAMLGPALIVHTVFTHAAVRCDLGPLGYVLVSPTFHRWHHEASRASPGCNFAGMFSCIDLAFGTFYLPEGEEPSRFGAPGDGVPEGLAGQLAHPFRVIFGAPRD